MRQYPNPRPVKRFRSYLVAEVATLLDVHRNTVRNWIKAGLPVLDEKKPCMIHGTDLREYLTAKRAARKRKCGKGEMYCLKCQKPCLPKDAFLEQSVDPRLPGNLKGRCKVCNTKMNRRVSLANLERIKLEFQVPSKPRVEDLTQCLNPPSSCDLKQEQTINGKAQP